MPKNKGFTLVELLVVLAIIAVIMTLASTSVISVLNKNRAKLATNMEENLESAGIAYIEENRLTLTKCTNINKDALIFSPSSCYKEIKVNDIIASALFEDNRGYCDKNASVWVYKENLGAYSELKAYVKKGTCK